MFLARRRFPNAVGPDEDHVRGVFQKLEGHERLNGAAIAPPGPLPVELAERFETPEQRALEPVFEAPAHSLVFLPLQERWQPRRIGDVDPVREHAVKP